MTSSTLTHPNEGDTAAGRHMRHADSKSGWRAQALKKYVELLVRRRTNERQQAKPLDRREPTRVRTDP
jgi:hypothetical protein